MGLVLFGVQQTHGSTTTLSVIGVIVEVCYENIVTKASFVMRGRSLKFTLMVDHALDLLGHHPFRVRDPYMIVLNPIDQNGLAVTRDLTDLANIEGESPKETTLARPDNIRIHDRPAHALPQRQPRRPVRP